MQRRSRRRVAISKVEIKTFPLSLKNAPPVKFMQECNRIPLLGYHVETASDGSRICVTKPGGKTFQDFQVWVVKPNGDAWRPSHGEIFDDLEAKCQNNSVVGREVVRALQRVHAGEEPGDAAQPLPKATADLPGYPADLILKVYKWIFAQEDCNYPPPRFEGRNMSMKGIEKLL